MVQHTSYQRRKLREYERILEATGLNPETASIYAQDDPGGALAFIASMKDQAIRSYVIYEYTAIDNQLNQLIVKHFFGTLHPSKRSSRYRTLEFILNTLYLQQKLSIVKMFKTIPRALVSKIMAVNDLRNGLAHSFNVRKLPEAKRTYKGIDIFREEGLRAFTEDLKEITDFFLPWLKNYYPDKNSGRARIPTSFLCSECRGTLARIPKNRQVPTNNPSAL